jgi:hypothetical protein
MEVACLEHKGTHVQDCLSNTTFVDILNWIINRLQDTKKGKRERKIQSIRETINHREIIGGNALLSSHIALFISSHSNIVKGEGGASLVLQQSKTFHLRNPI